MHAVSTAVSALGATPHAGPVGAPCADLRRETVGPAELRREDLTMLEGGRVMVLTQALGPPRLWAYLLDITHDAFSDGYLRAEGAMQLRLHQGMRTASHFVRTRIDALIERRGADVSILVLALEGPTLHVLSVGTIDAYLYRRRSLRRLHTRDEAPGSPLETGERVIEGMFKGNVGSHAEHVEPGDMLFAGSRAVCDAHVLARLGVALEHDRALSAQAIVATLGEAASERGLSAATVALRVPSVF